MKNLLLFGGLAFSLTAFSQTTIFQDNFESGTANWQLNGGTGLNVWVVNNVYAGFSGFIDDTPSQPDAVISGPNSSYLHINNQQICTAGVCNANFDTGSASDQKATLVNSISTTGINNISLSFWYLCAGAAGTSYGTVEYSTDGTAWNTLGNQLSGVTAWTQITLTDPALSNRSSLKFRFRWQNGSTGEDPAFSVDDVKVVGIGGSTATISELAADQRISFYPNPAIEYFEVLSTFNEPIERLVIRDNNGRKVRTYDKPKPEKFFIADIDPGIYTVLVTFGERTYMDRIVIE